MTLPPRRELPALVPNARIDAIYRARRIAANPELQEFLRSLSPPRTIKKNRLNTIPESFNERSTSPSSSVYSETPQSKRFSDSNKIVNAKADFDDSEFEAEFSQLEDCNEDPDFIGFDNIDFRTKGLQNQDYSENTSAEITGTLGTDTEVIAVEKRIACLRLADESTIPVPTEKLGAEAELIAVENDIIHPKITHKLLSKLLFYLLNNISIIVDSIEMVQARNPVLAEESAEVEVLFAEAAKFESVAKKITASLGRLESGGNVVKQSIGPIYSNTQSLQVVNGNVDKILAFIDTMQKPLDGKGREEEIINAGPEKTELGDYLASLKRVERALSQMNASNLRVNQQAIGDLNELLSSGNTKLETAFRNSIQQDARPVEPLHFITKQLPFPTIPQETVSQLGSIDSYISTSSIRVASYNQRDSPTIRAYIEIRGPYLTNSLKNLATASVNTSKKKSPDEIYRSRTNGIGSYASGIEGIFLAEYQNISAIFSREDWGTTFELTSGKALVEFSSTLRDLNTHIKSNITTDCFLAYEIIDIVTNLSTQLDSRTGQLKSTLIEALKPIRDTAKASLLELIEDIRRRVQALLSLPQDAASIPLTSEIMTRLQTLPDYETPLTSILASLGDGNWITPNNNNPSPSSLSETTTSLLPHYILDSMDTYLTTLSQKATHLLKPKPLHGVFIANNVVLMDRLIRSSDLGTLLSSPGAPSKIDSFRKKGTSAYLDSWREPCSALLDVQYTNRGQARPPSGTAIDSAAVIKGLSGKDKDTIKEKFKNFNSSFEELSARHRGLAMEREVRSQLAREVQAMIEPLYGRFWDRYHEVDKGKGKYVKFDKGGLAGLLAGLS